MQMKAAVYDSVLQFFNFKTGDGIESQEWVLKPELEQMTRRRSFPPIWRPASSGRGSASDSQHDPCHGGDVVAAGAAHAAASCR